MAHGPAVATTNRRYTCANVSLTLLHTSKESLFFRDVIDWGLEGKGEEYKLVKKCCSFNNRA